MKGQNDKTEKGKLISLIRNETMDGGFLPLTLSALGSLVPTVICCITRDLQIDSQTRPYRKIPKIK